MDLDDLLTALNLTELEALVKPIASNDTDLIADLSRMLTDATGDNDPDVPDVLNLMLTAMCTNLADTLGGGSDPVTTVLQAADANMTYAQLIRYAAAEFGADSLRAPVQATDAAPDILQYFADQGVSWGLPDNTIPDNPFGLGDGTSFDDSPEPMAAETGIVMRVSQELRDFAKSIRDMWQQTGDAKSTLADGPIVHLMLQMQYVEWAASKGHLAMVDNNLADPEQSSDFGPLLDVEVIKKFFKTFAKLADAATTDPATGPVIQMTKNALGQGKPADEFARPDILDLTSRELYEIKPVASLAQGLRDVFYYLILLNGAQGAGFVANVITNILSVWQKGSGFGGGVSIPDGFWMPGTHWTPQFPVIPMLDGRFVVAATCAPGLVLYEIFEADDPERVEQEALAASKAFAAGMLLKRLIQLKGQAAGNAAGEVAQALEMSPQMQKSVATLMNTVVQAIMAGALLIVLSAVLAAA